VSYLNGHGVGPAADVGGRLVVRDEPHFVIQETCAYCDRPLSDDGITGPDGKLYDRACFGKL